MTLNLLLEHVKDAVTRENFTKILRAWNNENLLIGNFKFYEIIFTKAETNKKIPHRLNFTPKDVIQTSLTGAGTLTWNYSLFDKDFLNITTSAACHVRAFIGNYSGA